MAQRKCSNYVNPQDQLRKLPKVDRLLAANAAEELISRFSRPRVVEAIRAGLDNMRERVIAGDGVDFSEESFFDDIKSELEHQSEANLRCVINATGIVLHTNLGRAPLAEAALAAVAEVARGYSNLEFGLDTGKRGSRHAHVEGLLCRLTGAESAVVVNNNAAAVMLAVNTFAKEAEVVTSRGELIEIGGSFRIPDVIEQSEAELVEVGTTNKTRIGDFAKAISGMTRILLKVHPSNYKIVGFTSAAEREEMVALAKEQGLLMVEDLGSGTLIDLARFGLAHETTVQEVVAAGVDLVTFSGDKLLGGPQAGIVAGRRDLIDTMKKNPLMRALRPDKMTLAALEATLLLYLDENRLMDAVPVLRMLAQSLETLEARAKLLCDELLNIPVVEAEVREGESYAGGGSLPDEAIPTRTVAVTIDGRSADDVAARLRSAAIPVVARIADDAVQFDVRTIADNDVESVVRTMREVAA